MTHQKTTWGLFFEQNPAVRLLALGLFYAILPCLVLVFLLLQTCFADSTQPPTALGSFPLSFQPDSGNPIVNVKADGDVAGVFALDTGCSYDFISSSLVTKLGLKTQTALLRMDDAPNGPPQSLPAVLVPSITAGSMTWSNRPMIVLDDQEFNYPPDIPMDGMIGLGTLSNYAVLVDPTSNSVTIYGSKDLGNLVIDRLGFDANTPIQVTRSLADGFYHVQASVENGGHTAPVDLELDTCSGSTKIPQTIANALHLKLGHRIKQPTMFSGDVQEKACTVPKLTIGNITVNNLPVICLNKDIRGYPPSLGRDVLFRGRVLFDFPDSKMYLAPPSTPASIKGH